jgi:hypothetical protein
VAVVSGTIRYQYQADVTAATWGAWSDSSIAISDNCKLGLAPGGRVFYQATDKYYYADFNGAGFDTPVQLTDWPGPTYATTQATCFMPIDDDIFFVYALDDAPLSDDSQAGNLYCYGLPLYAAVAHQMKGSVYGQQDVILSGDALAVDDGYYIFISAGNNKRAIYFKRQSNYYTEYKQLLPLDIMDDTSYLRMGLASYINNSIYVVGTVYRRNWVYDDTPATVCLRSMNGDHFTQEKTEYYIGRFDHNSRDVTINSQSVGVYDPPGKMMLIGDYQYFVCLGNLRKKLATGFCGKDPDSLRTTITENTSSVMSFRGDSMLGLETMDDDVNLTSVQPGDEITVQLGYDGVLGNIGVFDVDGLPITTGQTGEQKSIAASGRGYKRLRQWVSDAAYDYWSQTKEAGDPWDLTKLIRAGKATYSTDDPATYLLCDDLNIDGWLYSVGRPSRNMEVTASFDRNDGLDNQAGVFAGWYRETVEDAKTRLDVDTVEESDIGYHAIVVKCGKEALGNTQDAIGVWGHRPGQDPTYIAGSAQTPPTDEVYHIKLQLYEGCIMVHYRPDSSTNWTRIIYHRFTGAWNPYFRTDDQVGRGGVYMRNKTAWSLGLGMSSTIQVIPVESNADFPVSGTAQVDDELIEYVTRTNDYPVDYVNKHLHWDEGNVIRSNTDATNGVPFGRSRSERAIRQSFTATANMWVKTIRLKAWRTGDLEDGIRVMLYEGPITSRKPYGTRMSSGIVESIDITDTASVVTVTFDAPVKVLDNETYYVVVEREKVPGRGSDEETAGASNYYNLSISPYGESKVAWGSAAIFSDNSDDWSDQGNDLYIIIEGTPDGRRNQVMVTGSDLEPWKDFYKYMALCCFEGKGAGISMEIEEFIESTSTADVFIVKEDPTGWFDDTSVFVVAPTLICGTRGAQETVASSHIAGTQVNFYVAPVLHALSFSCYTSDLDMRLTDCVDAICAKAGVEVTHEDEYTGTHTGGSGTWTYDTPVADRRGIVRLKSDQPQGIAFDLDASNNGYLVATDETYVYLYTLAAGTPTLVERIINEHEGWVTYSWQGDHVSVWQDQRLLGTFTVSSNNRAKAAVASSGSTPVSIDWKELDVRVDNFVMEMGQDGWVIFQEIARQTRTFLQDTQDGEMRCFRNRTEVNVVGDPYDIVFDSTVIKTDAGLATRIRLVGIEEIEIPTTALDEYGDVFQMVNLNRGDDLQDMLEFWPYIQEDLDLMREPRRATAAFQPEVEPNDIFYVRSSHPTGVVTEKLYVESVDVVVNITETDAAIDMNLTGHV